MVTRTYKVIFHRPVQIDDDEMLGQIAAEFGFESITLNSAGRIMYAAPPVRTLGEDDDEEPVDITDYMLMVANIISDVENIAMFEEVNQYEPQFEELQVRVDAGKGLELK